MNDIITTMFNKKFMEELFKPQELYSKKALRTVYDRLAHASIMRLNQASMDKVKKPPLPSPDYAARPCYRSQASDGDNEHMALRHCNSEAFCNSPLPVSFLCKNGSQPRKLWENPQ